jgi:hypothetical protein
MAVTRKSLAARFLILAALGAVVVGASACGSSSPSPSSPSPAAQPAASLQYVSVTGSFLIGSIGGTTQLRANANTTAGPQDVTSQATWSSSNDAIATVSSGGLVSARGTGLVVITARYQGLSGDAGISVATPVNVTGTWVGSAVNPTSDISLELTQAGDSLSGRSTTVGGGSTYNGTLSGTLNGGTVILGGSVSSSSGALFGSWSDERCALQNPNSMRCVNPLTTANGFTLMEVTLTRQ